MSTRGLPLALALVALFAFAQPCAASREAAVDAYLVAAEPGLDTWRAEWDFYAWKPGWLSGESTVDAITVPLDNDVEDSLDFRNWSVGTRIESWMGPWGVVLDLQYFRLDSDAGEEPQETVGRVEQFIADIGLGLRVVDSGGKRPFTVDGIAIVRYSILKQSVSPSSGADFVEDKQNYAEFAVGLQLRKKISGRWWLWVRGDVGGFGWSQGSRLTCNVWAGASFELDESGGTMIKFGWRLYDIDYELREDPSAFSLDATVHGPFASFTWIF